MSRPVRIYRQGNVECAIFSGEYGFSFKFQKSYKTKDGQWKQSDFFGPADLPSLLVVVTKIAVNGVKEPFKDKPQEPQQREQPKQEQPRHFKDDDLPPF